MSHMPFQTPTHKPKQAELRQSFYEISCSLQLRRDFCPSKGEFLILTLQYDTFRDNFRDGLDSLDSAIPLGR